MTDKNQISIANDYSRYPAGRYVSDGQYSGERFRTEYLIPALETGKPLVVNLDGVRGYGSSFLEEAFGGLVREGYDPDTLKSVLIFETKDESLSLEIVSYIESATA